ncbi:hepatic leukemia factor isoform X5 [Sitodiplosis mosellana]|uniref:hepatic leukemia factor isoform X5 n=1 Tax=Sitodiplosis mosellana TaxID=263140 RepID=UPI0024453203|nr:hepatic leukemia factor isoform X5 [Sitodiplosis mosellana]
MRKMMLDGKISDYSMYNNNGSNWNSAASCQYPTNSSSSSSSNGFNDSNNCQKNQSATNDCNVNHYCQNPKFNHLANHWNGSVAAMHHQQAQPESANYFRNQWHFSNNAATNSYHVNDTTIPNIPATQLSQNQHCLLIPHTHFHHPSSAGKASGNSKDICGNDDKFKEDGDPWNVEAQAAFLGPNLWDKTLPYDTDLKVTHYADLDEFLSENNIPDGLPGTHLGHPTGLNHRPSVNDSLGYSTGLALGLGHITTKRERSPSPSDCVSPDTINPPSPAESSRDFDPRTRAFSDEELKPQPMIKKSRKQFVPDELKDDKYWARRRKNNIAAKRSRDARRQKENQIAMRARYLEKEISLQNSTLHQELEQLKQENMELRARLSKYQDA